MVHCFFQPIYLVPSLPNEGNEMNDKSIAPGSLKILNGSQVVKNDLIVLFPFDIDGEGSSVH